MMMMIRQSHKQDTLSSAVTMGPGAKAAMIRPGGADGRPLSKNNRLSHTPGLHLSAAPGQGLSAPLKPSPSSSSSRSSSAGPAAAEQRSEVRREAENFPPRRPLKLAPLELPLEVKEAQWQKIRSVQQEVKVSALELEAAGGPRKVKACGTDGVVRSSARSPLTTILNPYKLQQRAGRALPLPVTQTQPANEEGSAGKETDHNLVPASKSDLQSGRAEHTAGQSACAGQTAGQSACTEMSSGQSALAQVQDGGCRRRSRLRRGHRLEEDQSKSGSSTGGLRCEEGRPDLARPGPGQRSTERALREAGRVLEKASRRNQPGTALGR